MTDDDKKRAAQEQRRKDVSRKPQPTHDKHSKALDTRKAGKTPTRTNYVDDDGIWHGDPAADPRPRDDRGMLERPKDRAARHKRRARERKEGWTR